MDGTPKTDTDVNCTEGLRDQRSMITGNKYFILAPGKKSEIKEDFIRNVLHQISGQQVCTVQECDAILVFCFVVSRAGADIDAALNALNAHSESKPAVFMVVRHTFYAEKVVPDSRRYVSRVNTLTVDCFFNEDEGLLNCVKNSEALTRIHQWLQPQGTQAKTEMSNAKSASFNERDLIVASELILVLLGTSVREKTAVEHMIFGREESQADTSQATQRKITVDNGVVDGGQVAVINTPDWFSSGLSTEEIQQTLQFWIDLFSQKPYTLLLVIPVKQFKEKEREIVEKMEKVFQDRFRERLMIIVTATNDQEEQEIRKFDPKPLMAKWGSWFHYLNISQIGNRSQVSELLKTVEEIVAGKGKSNECELTQNQIDKASEKSKQVIVGEARNFIKASLKNPQRTVWISLEPSEPFEMLNNTEET